MKKLMIFFFCIFFSFFVFSGCTQPETIKIKTMDERAIIDETIKKEMFLACFSAVNKLSGEKQEFLLLYCTKKIVSFQLGMDIGMLYMKETTMFNPPSEMTLMKIQKYKERIEKNINFLLSLE